MLQFNLTRVKEDGSHFSTFLLCPNIMDHCIQFKIALAPLAAISHCKLISNLSSIISSRSPLVLLVSRLLLSIELFCSRCIGFYISKLNLILLLLTHITTLTAFIYISSQELQWCLPYVLNCHLQIPLRSCFHSSLTQENINIMKITPFSCYFKRGLLRPELRTPRQEKCFLALFPYIIKIVLLILSMLDYGS